MPEARPLPVPPTAAPMPNSRWVHCKSKKLYRVVELAYGQALQDGRFAANEGTWFVIYRAVPNGRLPAFHREVGEFLTAFTQL